MEEVAKFLFPLANADRLALLFAIRSKEQRLTQLAGTLSSTVQETSKHLARLSDARLIERDAVGVYRLTSLGKSVLELLPAFGLLARNRAYFLSHELSFLPPEFVERIGELAEHIYGDHVGSILRHAQEVFGTAREYIYIMVDDPSLPSSPLPRAPSTLDVPLRMLLPAKTLNSDAYGSLKDRMGPNAQLNVVDHVNVAIAMNEHLAGVCFPDLQGKVDFNGGLRGSGPGFLSWCRALFHHYWEQSSPFSSSKR